jgi:hypothetical protein
MKILIVKIFFLILLEFGLSRGALCDDSDEQYFDRDNEISADVDEVMKVIGSVLSKRIDEDGRN